jgi:integrase
VEGWKALLQRILDQYNHYYKDNGKARRTVSHKTRDDRAMGLFLCFRTLREKLGYSIDNPANLKPKHVEALVRHWEARGLSAATIQTRLSFLRAFADWIGKPGMITASVNYVANPDSVKRTYAADRDKGWEANGIDMRSKILEIAISEPYVGMQLKVASTFGLRRKEAVMFDADQADHGTYLLVSQGTKGGLKRSVEIDTPEKRAVIEEAKAFAMSHGGSKSSRLGDPAKTLKQNLAKYSNVMSKHGITLRQAGTTAHGLRHQFACDRLAEQGVIAPVRGGQPDQMSHEDRTVAYKKVSEELGHSRESVIAAYAGRFIRNRRASKSEKPTELEMSPVYEDGEG